MICFKGLEPYARGIYSLFIQNDKTRHNDCHDVETNSVLRACYAEILTVYQRIPLANRL